MDLAWKKDNLPRLREAINLPHTREANVFLWNQETSRLRHLLVLAEEPWDEANGMSPAKLLAVCIRLEFKTIESNAKYVDPCEKQLVKMDKKRFEQAKAAKQHLLDEENEVHEEWQRQHEEDLEIMEEIAADDLGGDCSSDAPDGLSEDEDSDLFDKKPIAYYPGMFTAALTILASSLENTS